ncbi:MAG TPA: SprB repeat-containing protein, partial [Saprospiraceae bacterium]|nr:SprB repeat-containing protein [Saprospiraceae bacterium]
MKINLRAVLTAIFTTASLAMASAQFILSFSVTEPTCFGLATGAVTVTPIGGIGPYSYQWSTGAATQTISDIPAGTYGVTVTGANGVVSQNITVDQPTQVLANISGDTCRLPVTLFAVGSGGTGPYTYTWDGMIPGQTLTVTTPGTYCVTVVDTEWCGIVECVKISAGSINLNVQATNLTCPNVNTGQVQATVTGGAPPYTFQWSNGLQGPAISNLAAGTYTVTVTDTRGCSVTATATVTSPPPLIAAITP